MKIEKLELPDENIAGLTVIGRVDAHTVAPLETWLTEAAATRGSMVLVDLEQVAFIDTRAISVLVQAMKRCRQSGGELMLCNLSQAVRVIFELMRLDRAFAIYDSVDAAFEKAI